MQIINCEQLSPEWFAARAGVPSASCFDKIVTTKGEPSKQRTKYMYQLAGERITGKKEDTYTNAIMQRGVDMEAEARDMFTLVTDLDVEEVGLCKSHHGYSCSPDGLIDGGGLEIKCPTLSVHVEYLLKGKLPTTYFQQVQGSMLVTQTSWWYFMSYYPGMKPLIIKVDRNNEFAAKLNVELIKFNTELDEIVIKIQGD